MTLEEVTTLKEAIKRLKEVIKEVRSTIQPFLYDNEAKDYILKALEQEPCEDAVSRQAVIDGIDNYIEKVQSTGAKDDFISFEELVVKALPSIQPKPKIGHWIDDEFGSKCSCCNIYTHLDKFDRPMLFRYCSMCGAKMVEPKESEDKDD